MSDFLSRRRHTTKRCWRQIRGILADAYKFMQHWLSALVHLRFFQTTTFRLTFLNLAVSTILSVAVFLVVYASLALRLQKQMDKALLTTAEESAAIYRQQGIAALQYEFEREAESQGSGRVFFRLLSSDGTSLASSDLSKLQESGLSIPNEPATQGTQSENYTFHLHLQKPEKEHGRRGEADERDFQIRMISMPIGGGEVLQVGKTLYSEELILEKYRETFGVALMVMGGLGGLLSFLLARKAMAGVQRITDTATSIGGLDLAGRVPLGDEGEEIKALARAFNAMLERIEILFSEVRQVTDNVAHELRTPITRIRGMAETTLKGDDNLIEYKETMASVIDGCDDLIEIIGTMLEIAKTDSGNFDFDPVSLDLIGLVEDAVDLFLPVAEDKRIDIHLNKPAMAAKVTGDRRRLQRVVSNILDNAVKYTPHGGLITVTIKNGEGDVRVSISDTGIGVSESDLPHIFERFFRSDKSRSTSGNGLGLSLAMSIIRAHGGDITVVSSDQGATFTVLLPSSPSSRHPF